MAFWPTFQAWQQHRQLTAQVSKEGAAGNISYQPGYLQRKSHNLNRVLRLYRVDTGAYREKLLSAVATLAEQQNVRVVELPATLATTGAQVEEQTGAFHLQSLRVEGSYPQLMHFLSQLQAAEGIGQVCSAQYSLVQVQQGFSAQKKLQLQIFLQTIR